MRIRGSWAVFYVDRNGATITPGVLEMAARVNLSATSFLRAAALERTAQAKLSGERLRQVVETTGRRVLKAQQNDAVAVTWHAEDCALPDGETGEKKRVYTGCDGVMAPIITDAEKIIDCQVINVVYTSQERESRSIKEAVEYLRRLGRLAEISPQHGVELKNIVRREIGHTAVLQMTPQVFNGIEFGSIRW